MNEREAIDAAIAAWNADGVDAFLEFMAPDVEWHAPPGFLEGDVFRGRDSLAPVEQFASIFQNSRIEQHDVVRGPNGWLISGLHTSEHGGTKVEWQGWYVVDVENGLMKRMWVFMDREPALLQAGLDE